MDRLEQRRAAAKRRGELNNDSRYMAQLHQQIRNDIVLVIGLVIVTGIISALLWRFGS